MQVASSRFTNSIATSTTSTASDQVNVAEPKIRDQMEKYLTSADKSDRTKTLAAHQASNYADFFAEADFREQLERVKSGVGTDTDVTSQWSYHKKVAYGYFQGKILDDQIAQNFAELADRLRANGYTTVPMMPVASPSRPFNAEEIGREFEQTAQSGMIDILESIDKSEQAGESSISWESAFRSRVTRLDHQFDLMRRAYSAYGQDQTEITRRYEEVLGQLYDYAVERDRDVQARKAG